MRNGATKLGLGPPSAVRLHPVGRAYSVIHTWIDSEQRYQGWYVSSLRATADNATISTEAVSAEPPELSFNIG